MVTELRPWSPAAPLPTVEFWIDDTGPFTALVDSGNGTTGFAISASLARRLKLPPAVTAVDSAPQGVGGAADLHFVRARRVRLGTEVWQSMAVGVSSAFDRLAEVVGAPLDGNLGYGLLKHHRVRLDWGARAFELSPSAGGAAAGAPFDVAPGKPLVVTTVQLDGGGLARAVFDTGASTNLVSPALATRLGLALGADTPVHGVGGVAQGRGARIEALGAGSDALGPIDVVVSSVMDRIAEIAGIPVDMLLGPDAVGTRAVVIDYPAGRLHIGASESGRDGEEG